MLVNAFQMGDIYRKSTHTYCMYNGRKFKSNEMKCGAEVNAYIFNKNVLNANFIKLYQTFTVLVLFLSIV